MMARFEAVFYPAEAGERVAEWDVVEYETEDGLGNRVGKVVKKFYGDTLDDEQDARIYAEYLNIMHDQSLEIF
jgi:hypothetical protein